MLNRFHMLYVNRYIVVDYYSNSESCYIYVLRGSSCVRSIDFTTRFYQRPSNEASLQDLDVIE